MHHSSESSRRRTIATPRRAGRVLVVDGEPRIADAIALVLDEHAVTAVTDAQDALVRLGLGQRYDVILSEVAMAGMSGVEFYEHLRALDVDQAARVVFFTGDARRPDVRRFLSEVPNTWIEKPFDSASLRAFIVRRIRALHAARPRRQDVLWTSRR
jgi:CheY-like chemotaxis protein